MAARYKKIFSLDGMRYTSGAPLLIAAGALLQDSYSGELLCQLKLRSLSERPVKAAAVVIRMLDIALAPLPPEKSHRYLDLDLARGEEFGSDTAIVLPRRDARAFTVTLSEVIFADNSRWCAEEGCEWLSLAPPRTLEEAYGDAQLAEQFRIRYGADCRDFPGVEGELWFCTCGAVNRTEEQSCWRCRRVCAALLDVNPEALRQEAAGRLRQEEARRVLEKSEGKQRRRKHLKLAGIVLPLLILAAGLAVRVPQYVQQKQCYDGAVLLLASGRYEQAAEAFRALGDYRDSAEQAARNVPYQRALHIFDRAKANDASALGLVGRSRADLTEELTPAMLLYEGARAEFEALGGYKDSAGYLARCDEGVEAERLALKQEAYDRAAQLLEEGQYSLAREAFLALEDFSDSADMAQEALYRKALALYDIIRHYDVRRIYADLSSDPARGSSFSLPKAVAFAQGSQLVSELRAACGGDLADVALADEPAAPLRPLAVCVTELFTSLDGYRDSAECIAGIKEATDYTKDFFMLCQAGDLGGALEWLAAYDGEFAERERWQGLLEFYLPYCAAWKLYGGDPTVIPLTVGRGGRCENFSTRVILEGERAILRISANDGEEYFTDLYAELGSSSFGNFESERGNYLLALTNAGRLSYMQYDKAGKLRTSCEYSRDT